MGLLPAHPGWRRLGLVLCLALTASGCDLERVPTAAHPSCSWTTSPPSNADEICVRVFRSVSAVALAEIDGNTARIRSLVVTSSVATKIIAHGFRLRAQRVHQFHVVPSITLAQTPAHLVGAGFFLAGRKPHGKVSPQEQVYLKERGNTYVIVGDQPSQEW